MRRPVFAQKCLCLLFGLSASVSIQAAPYDVIDLGVFGDTGSYNFAFGINNLNQVVGNAEGALIPADQLTEGTVAETCLAGNIISVREFCNHAYFYEMALITDLGALDTGSSYAFAINDSTTAVGYATEEFDNGDPDVLNPVTDRAVVSLNGQPLTAIPFPVEVENLNAGVTPLQRALDINNSNQVAGYTLLRFVSDDDTEAAIVVRPYIYDLLNETYTFIPMYSDNIQRAGNARAINEAGAVAGWANSEDDERNNPITALYWDPATPEFSQDLGTLGGFSSEAYDLNDNGIIVGVSDTDTNFFRNESLAFYYDIATETMNQIPEFSEVSEFTNSQALAVNDSNQVVGSAQVSASFESINAAFLYQVGDDSITNLNDMIDCDLGWDLVLARDINDAGYIIGTGTLDGEVRSFMLVPTSDTTPTNCTQPNSDEPGSGDDSSSSSMGFIAILLAGFVLLRRRFRI